MKQQVKLLNYTPLRTAVIAIRTCWDSIKNSDTTLSGDNIGEKDKELIQRVGVKNKHSSTLEHLVYSFSIKGISRALLQELARHRIASLSVKSTRYTLKELRQEKSFIQEEQSQETTNSIRILDKKRAEKYVVLTENKEINDSIIMQLEKTRELITQGISNDRVKYSLPEAYKTELVWTINARSLRNFIKLRTNKSALNEIQKLAYNIYKEIPNKHKYLFTDCLYRNKEDYKKWKNNHINL